MLRRAGEGNTWCPVTDAKSLHPDLYPVKYALRCAKSENNESLFWKNISSVRKASIFAALLYMRMQIVMPDRPSPDRNIRMSPIDEKQPLFSVHGSTITLNTSPIVVKIIAYEVSVPNLPKYTLSKNEDKDRWELK